MLKKISKILQQIIGRAKKKSKSKRKVKPKSNKMLEIATPLERSLSDQHQRYVDLKKHGPIFVSTNSLSSADFSTYLETSDIIESTSQKVRKSKRVRRQSSLKIKKTREEIFEVSTVDETEFKQTLEDNGADNSSEIRKLDLSKSIEELMRYFDKDVNPDDFDKTAEKSMTCNKIKVADLVKELEKEKTATKPPIQKPVEIAPFEEPKPMPKEVDDKSMYLRTNVPLKPRRMRRQTQVISAPPLTVPVTAATRNSYDEYKKLAKEELTEINSKKNISPRIRAMAELFDHKLSPLKPALKSDQKNTQSEKMKKLTIQHVEMPQIDSCPEEIPIPRKRTVFPSSDAPKPRPRSKCLDRYDFGNKLSIFKGQREPENVIENKEPEEKSNVSKIIQSVENRCSPNKSSSKSGSSPKNTKLNKSCNLEIPAYQKCIEQLKQINSNEENNEPKVVIEAIKPNGILRSTSKVLDVVATEASYLVNKKHDDNTIHRNTNIVQNKSNTKEILCNNVSKVKNVHVHEAQDNQNSKYDTTGCLIHDEILSKISVKEKVSLFNKFIGEISNSTKHQQSCSNNSSQENQQKQSKLPKNQVIRNINKVIADLKNKLTETKPNTASNTIVNKSKQDRHITSITVNLQSSQKSNSTMATTTTEITDSISHLDSSFLPHLQAINSTNHLTYALEDTVSGPLSDSQIDMDSIAPSKLVADADTIVEPFGNSTIANMDKQTLSELLTQSIEINEESKDDSQKRSNKSLCGCIPFDVYGPPRKIRRTALERSGIFVNQQLESMFYEWLIEYNNKSASQSTPKRKEFKGETIESQTDDQEAGFIEKEEKALVDQVLSKDEDTKTNIIESSPKKQSLRRSLRWKIDECIIEKSTPPPPPDTDPPQLDTAPPSFEIVPMKLTIKIPEEMPHHPSSEDDGRYSIASSILSKCQLFDNDSDTARRRSFIIGAPVNNRNGKLNILDAKNDQLSSLFEVDAKLLKKCQSPDQFKKAYILTVLSSPSPSLTSDCEHFNPESFKYNHLKDSSFLSRSWSHLPSMENEQSKLADTLSTTAGDIPASPYTKSIRSQQSQSCQNLINESSTLTSTINDFSSVFADKSFTNKSCQLPSLAEHIENEAIENNSNRIEVDFVSTTNPSIKEVRFSDSDSTQENKPVKQVIKYRKTPKKPSVNCGKPKTMTQLFATPVKKQTSEEKIIKATATVCNSELCRETRDTSFNNTALHMDLQTSNILNQCSKFWIISKNCILKFTIYYVQSKELNELKEIFGRESSKSSKINFGVDSVHYFSKQKINMNLSKTDKYSKYWFAVGNHIVNFNGHFIPEPQIHQAFQLLRGSDLRFGIDTVEFSTNSKTLNKNDASLARASIYSKTSDLAPSDFESDSDHHELKNIFGKKINQKTKNEHRLSSSTEDPPSSEAVSPDSGEVLTSEPDDEHINFYNDGDPLDNLFTWIRSSTDKVMQNMIRPLDKSLGSESDQQQSEADEKIQEDTNNERRKMKNIKIGKISSDAFNRLLSQREEILKLQKQLRASKFKSFTTGTTFPNLAEANTPYEHLKRLQNMVKAIEFIASSDGYVNCSRVQLESFIYALCKHADLCLLSCITQINKILQIIVQLEPPENELQKSHDSTAALSEHQLRVQASLQRLNIPDWYRAYSSSSGKTGTETINIPGQNNLNIQTSTTTTTTAGGYKPGSFTRKRASDSGRWAGLNSKTTSLSSLGSQRSDRSPLLLSPSAHSHHGTTTGGCQTTSTIPVSGGFSRWSTSYLNSTQTSPSVSQRGSFSRGGPINSSFSSVGGSGVNTSSVIRSSFRQPYMGWRSQEKINQPRTPHERLASSLLSAKPPKTEQVAVTPEIQSSIKEVTSAIVHHFNDQNRQPTNLQATRSRSTSPNSRKCWLESSFVGVRPLESPQTPTIETNTFTAPAGSSGLTTVTAATTILTNQQQQQQQSQYLINNQQQQQQQQRQPTIYDPVSTFRTHINTPQRYQQQISQQQQQQQQYHQQPSDIIRINGVVPTHLGALSTALERSPSSASLEDVLASLLGLPPNDSSNTYRSTGDTANELVMFRITNSTQNQQQHTQQKQQPAAAVTVNNLQVDQQGRFRRRSEGDAQKQKQQQQQQKIASANAASAINAAQINSGKNDQNQQQQQQQIQQSSQQQQQQQQQQTQQPPRRVSLDSSESKGTTSDLLIKCRNTKCENAAVPVDARKYYKSCHNCSHLYCSRECRRAHWEKHRKACLHSRVSNLCRQVLSACKDDTDSLRHLSLLARKGYLAQGRGVVRILFRSPESAEGFIKNGFQCMGEASYVRWPDLMPAEMGLELYSELLRLSTEYKPDTKMLIYVAICVVSEAPGTATAPVKWERQLVSRCAKLKLCKTILSELAIQQDSNQQNQIPTEPSIEILILTFDCQKKQQTQQQKEIILQNIINVLNRKGVILKKHYPEIYQRLQNYTEGQTERFLPVTLHPRDSTTGQGFVCIIMPTYNETDIQLPTSDIGNRVTTIDIGEELLES